LPMPRYGATGGYLAGLHRVAKPVGFLSKKARINFFPRRWDCEVILMLMCVIFGRRGGIVIA